MFIFKNAWKSIIRAKGRNILIGIIVLVIALSSCIALSIQSSANYAKESGMENTKVSAKIEVDREALMANMQSSGGDREGMRKAFSNNSLSLNEYESYSKASSVPVTSYYTDSVSLNSSSASKLSPVESETSVSQNEASGPGGAGMPGGGRGGMFGNSGSFQITGFSDDTALANAQNGTFTLSSGKVFDYTDSSLNKSIISQDLATFNSLKVGDTMTLTNPGNTTETYSLEVVGIYKNTTTTDNNSSAGVGPSLSDPANAIYTNIQTLDSIIAKSQVSPVSTTSSYNGLEQSSSFTSRVSYSYLLSSKDDYETFSQDVKNAGLSSSYKVTSPDVEKYEASLVPLENLSSFATNLLWIILIVGAIVLVILNVFNIRDRKYEVGVLTAIGIKKWKVATQFGVELLIITLISILLGTGIGVAASPSVANNMLASQIASQKAELTNQVSQFGREMMGGPGGGAFRKIGSQIGQNVEYLSSINASIDLSTVAILIIIGVLLTIISSIVAIVFIARYEPLQILADRN